MENTNNNEIVQNDNMETLENKHNEITEKLLNGNTKKSIELEYGLTTRQATTLISKLEVEYNSKSRRYEPKGSGKARITETKVTHRLPIDLYKAVKLQAVFDECNATDIIVKALEQYIPKTTRDIVSKNKK